MPSQNLIFDRTLDDVSSAQTLRTKKAQQMATSTETQTFLAGVRGSLVHSDLNRIEEWTKYLAGLLTQYSYTASVNIPAPAAPFAKNLTYTGGEQVLTIPKTDTYTLTAYGAAGGKGNTFSGDFGSVGGRGAMINGTFSLSQGDVLHIIVGGVGTGSTGTAKDGAGGGSGGGTFVFREIPAITDSRYQFQKGTQYFETLLVAAGGGGAWDESYKGSRGDGADGYGTPYTPDNFRAFSTTTANPASSAQPSGVLGIQQYITYDLQGSFYTRNSSTGQGGFGGGAARDDTQSYGGGWSESGTSYQAASWSLDTLATGTTGARAGNGYLAVRGAASGDIWSKDDILRVGDMRRIRNNVDALRTAFFAIPEWRAISYALTVGFEDINTLEWNLQMVFVYLEGMIEAMKLRQANTNFMIAGGILQ